MTVRDAETRLNAAPELVGRLRNAGLAVGAVAAVLCGIGLTLDGGQLAHSWLLACTLWTGVSLGSLALLMIHHLTGGTWGIPARRIFEAAAGVLPLMAIFFLPLWSDLGVLYPWARPEAAHEPLLVHKAAYLNDGFFLLRFAVYFVLWTGLWFLLRRLSLRQDREGGDPKLLRRMATIAAPGLVLWAFSTTFAFLDWLMSLEPLWFSTIYGVYFFGGTGLSALAVLILVSAWLQRGAPMSWALEKGHFHDWGKLLFAFVLLWSYFAVSQYLIIWSGNLPEEIEWYLHRTTHGWGWVASALVLFHFALPFALLLSRDLKKRPGRLAAVAAFLLLMRWVDHLWQIAPARHPEALTVHWLDLAAPLAVGGLWLAAFAWLLGRHPVLPPNDPYLEESVGESAGGEEAVGHV